MRFNLKYYDYNQLYKLSITHFTYSFHVIDQCSEFVVILGFFSIQQSPIIVLVYCEVYSKTGQVVIKLQIIVEVFDVSSIDFLIF